MALAAILAAVPVPAAILEEVVEPGVPAEIRLPVAVDDAHLRNPFGYFPPEPPSARVVKRITVENAGDTDIENPVVLLNGRPLLPVADPRAILGDHEDFEALFREWTSRRVHGTSDLDVNRDPTVVLTTIGATFCGDDSRALGVLAAKLGGEMQFARLEGHSVGEFRFGNERPRLFDGDQNMIYLRWDNATACSEADILDDPLLALRTRVFGRQSRWNLETSWQNMSRFEFEYPGQERKRFKPPEPHPFSWTFPAGGKLVIDLERTPERVPAANGGLRENRTLRSVVCPVEAQFPEGATLPWPEPQVARTMIPELVSGVNRLESKSGRIRVRFEYDDSGQKVVEAPLAKFEPDGMPAFSLGRKEGEKVWWQVLDDAGRAMPNLDQVSNFTPVVRISSPIDQSFLSPGREYRFHARVRDKGVWSDWSEPLDFEVTKPERPVVGAVEIVGDRAVLAWKGEGAGEMLVFGSDRIDFLPEVYGNHEIVAMENGRVVESRANRNLLATTPAAGGRVEVPLMACYRLIVRDQQGRLSVPSNLARLPAGTNTPGAQVLQTRHLKPEGALTGRDAAAEVVIP